jgi:hypothetical protein
VFSDDDATAPPPDLAEMTQVIEMNFESGLQPPSYIVVEWKEPPASATVLPYEVVPELELEPAPAFEVVEALSLDSPEQPPVSRRWIYARLALVRKALRAWDKLRSVLADPKDPLDRPGRVLALMNAAVEVRPLFGKLRGIVGGVGQPGAIVAAVVSQRLILDTVRSLLPSQRQTVAIDWRRGQSALQHEYARLRGLARAGRESPRGPPVGMSLWRWITETPELVLLALSLVALVVAMIRSTGGR